MRPRAGRVLRGPFDHALPLQRSDHRLSVVEGHRPSVAVPVLRSGGRSENNSSWKSKTGSRIGIHKPLFAIVVILLPQCALLLRHGVLENGLEFLPITYHSFFLERACYVTTSCHLSLTTAAAS